LKKPQSAAPRNAFPRGSGIRKAAAIPKRSTDASVSRMVAAQTGGVASLPRRIARNVLPQIAEQAMKVTAMRIVTNVERSSPPRREPAPSVAQETEARS